MKTPTISEAFISSDKGALTIEVDSIDDLLLPTENYFNFEGFDFNNFFEVHHFKNIVYKIFQNSKEVPLANSKILFEFIDWKNTKNTIQGKTIPKNYDFSNFDLSAPFLVEFIKGSVKKIHQNGVEVVKHDADKIVSSKWEFWSEKFNNLLNNDINIEEILNNKKDYSSLFRVDYNYENKPRKIDIRNSMSNRRLPYDAYLSIKEPEIDNFNLHLNKFIFHKEIQDNKGEWKREITLYRKGENEIFDKKFFDKQLITSISKRHYDSIKELKYQFGELREIKPNWRLIVGLGNASVYETSMTLHHIYGFPYIPASAIKGVFRSYIIQEVFENSETKALDDRNNYFQKIFGTQESDGKIIFFDAFPTKPPKIKVDVMTPHYGDYYSKDNVAPTDTMPPTPIPFLTVEDTPFKFFFGSKDFDFNQELWELKINKEKITGTLRNWLSYALQNHGIGAKTAVGYGYMKETS